METLSSRRKLMFNTPACKFNTVMSGGQQLNFTRRTREGESYKQACLRVRQRSLAVQELNRRCR